MYLFILEIFHKLLRRPNPKHRAIKRIKIIKMKHITWINERHFFFIDFEQHLFASGLFKNILEKKL